MHVPEQRVVGSAHRVPAIVEGQWPACGVHVFGVHCDVKAVRAEAILNGHLPQQRAEQHWGALHSRMVEEVGLWGMCLQGKGVSWGTLLPCGVERILEGDTGVRVVRLHCCHGHGFVPEEACRQAALAVSRGCSAMQQQGGLGHRAGSC